MHERDFSDAVLAEESSKFLDLLATYGEGCRALEEIEARSVKEQDVDDMQRHVIASGRQWRASLLRIGASAAYTDMGIIAKCTAVQAYFAEYPAHDVEAIALINSLVEDIKQRLILPTS
jgi:hypothetical protein